MRTKKFLSGLVSTNLSTLLSSIIGLVLTPFLLRELGDISYGYWIVISNIVGYLGLFDIGVSGSLGAIVAKNNNENSDGKLSIVTTMFYIQLLIALVIMVVGVSLSPFLVEFLEVTPDDKAYLSWVFIVSVISFSINIPLKSLNKLIEGKQYIALSSWIRFLSFLIMNAFAVLMIKYYQWNVIALPVGSMISTLFSFSFNYSIVKKIEPKLSLTFKEFDKKNVKNLLGFSLLWFGTTISATIIYTTDNIFVSKIFGLAIVPVYASTFRLSDFFRQRLYTIGKVLAPGVGQLWGEHNYKKIKDVFEKSFQITISLAIILCGAIYLYNKWFISHWVGIEYYGGQNITLLASVYMLLMVVYHLFSIFITSNLKLKEIVKIRCVEAILNLIFTYVLANYIGMIGVVLATISAHLITSFWFVPRLFINTFKQYNVLFNYKFILANLCLFVTTIIVVFILSLLLDYDNIYYSMILYMVYCLISFYIINMKYINSIIKKRHA